MEGLLVAFAVIVLAIAAFGKLTEFLSSNSHQIIAGLVYIGLFVGAIFLLAKAKAAGQRAAENRESTRQSKLASERLAKAERIRDEAARKLRKTQLYSEIIDCRQRVISFVSNAPILVSRSEDLLQAAVGDFGDRAFYPFWENLEQSTKIANTFQEKLTALKDDADKYKSLTKEFQSQAPDFPATSELAKHLRISLETVQRIKAVERQAHRDFEFSQIYGTRRTNNILIAGFQNMSDALTSIERSIDRVTVELEHGFANVVRAQFVSAAAIASAIDSSATAIIESNTDLRDAFAGETSLIAEPINDLVRMNIESSEREKFAIKALDNIQRNRKPLPFSDH